MFTVRTMPIDQLQPSEYNPRKQLMPTDKAYLKLKQSLEQFGLVEPLVWNEATNRIVGGHARLRILRELGYTEVPVSVVNLCENRERALNVVLNNQEAQGQFDPIKLADLLEGIRDLPEFAFTGFDPSILNSLRFEPLPPEEPDAPTGETVEVTIVADAEVYGSFARRLDDLVSEFDLVTHVKRL